MNESLLAQGLQDVGRSAQESAIARDWTHPLYRYPASMSPGIARSLLRALTAPGEVILDPFCGGGTTAVEALAHGRRVICSDLNNLACFVTRAKASPLSRGEIASLTQWVDRVAAPLLLSRDVKPAPLLTSDGREHVPHTHGLLLELGHAAERVSDYRVRQMARLTVLRTGQVCFDSRQKALSPSVLPRAFVRISRETIQKVEEYSQRCATTGAPAHSGRRLRVFCADAQRVARLLGNEMKSIACVLTSPPYPGVHVLYHRWQFRGRKEIALPYTLAALTNGNFESYYTLGSRGQKDQSTYFLRLRRIFASLNRSLSPGTIVAQLVAFSDAGAQLGKYLKEMGRTGLVKVKLSGHRRRLIERAVPNRRWYIRTGATACRMKEYVILHRSTGCVP